MLTPTSELNLPPRKLLNRRSPTLEIKTPDTHLDDEDDLDPYSTDEFRMYEFKIRRCMRSRSHDWTDCPFVHPGEKARRRDPRRFHYSGTPCADFRHGTCPRGDSCEFAHGVFECWLHPARYRTNACKDGRNCKRKVCFFAHTPRQLRVLPIGGSSSGSASSPTTHSSSSPHSHCCEGCSPIATSPTSTLPPISSSNLFSRFNEVALKEENYNFKKALLMELVSSLEAMGITTLEPSGGRGDYGFEWGGGGGEGRGKGGDVLYSDDCLGGMNGPDLEWVNELVM